MALKTIRLLALPALMWGVAYCYSPYQVCPLYLEVFSPTSGSLLGYITSCFTGLPGTAGLCYVEGGPPTNDGGQGSPNYFFYNTTTEGDLTSGVISSLYPKHYFPPGVPGISDFVMSLSETTAGSNVASLNVATGVTNRLVVGFDTSRRMYRIGVDESNYTPGPSSTGANPPTPNIAYTDWVVCWMYVQKVYMPFLAWLHGHERVSTNPTCVDVVVSMTEVHSEGS